MTEFFQHLVNGLSLGTIYALIALGYTMVYGVLKLINFAHGDVYMVGAFAGLYLGRFLGIDAAHISFYKTVVIFLSSMIICAVLGIAIERFAYRPLRNRPRLNALITAIGVSMLLEYGFQLHGFQVSKSLTFPPGPTPNVFPNLFGEYGRPWDHWVVGGVTIPYNVLILLVVAFALMIGLQFVVYRTRFGTSMRAVSFDSTVAGLMGINVNAVIAGTFALGSSLAAVAGLLVASSRPKIEPLFGLLPGIKAFVAAVIGGIGSVPGAMLGGLVLGLSEEYVAGYHIGDYALSPWRDAIAFALLILVLLVRPAGILGTIRAEKV